MNQFAEFDKMIGKTVFLKVAGLKFKGSVRQVRTSTDSSRGGCLDLNISLSLVEEEPPKSLTNYSMRKEPICLGGPKGISGPIASPEELKRLEANITKQIEEKRSPLLIGKQDDDVIDVEVL